MAISAVISVRPQVTPPTLLNSFEQNWYVRAVQGWEYFFVMIMTALKCAHIRMAIHLSGQDYTLINFTVGNTK
jgi:hypothetical protein